MVIGMSGIKLAVSPPCRLLSFSLCSPKHRTDCQLFELSVSKSGPRTYFSITVFSYIILSATLDQNILLYRPDTQKPGKTQEHRRSTRRPLTTDLPIPNVRKRGHIEESNATSIPIPSTRPSLPTRTSDESFYGTQLWRRRRSTVGCALSESPPLADPGYLSNEDDSPSRGPACKSWTLYYLSSCCYIWQIRWEKLMGGNRSKQEDRRITKRSQGKGMRILTARFCQDFTQRSGNKVGR